MALLSWCLKVGLLKDHKMLRLMMRDLAFISETSELKSTGITLGHTAETSKISSREGPGAGGAGKEPQVSALGPLPLSLGMDPHRGHATV